MSIYDFSFTNHFFGNENLNNMLTNVINSNRLSHAYLFYGTNNLFKTHVALNFAMKILCKTPNNQSPCGSCPACKKVLSGSHPDLYLYNLDGEARVGKDSIHIETTKFIRNDAFIKPNESEYKIYVIPNIQDMSIGAVNAFLKILEEPPTHTIFLLTAISKTAILDTILSRCIHFEVFPITIKEEIEALNILRPNLTAEEINKAATLSNGFLGKAINLLENEHSNVICDIARNATIALLNNNEYKLLLEITKANTSRVDMLSFLSEFSIYLKMGLKHKICESECLDDLIIALSKKFSIEVFYNFLQTLEEVRTSINYNVNMEIFCLNLSSKLTKAKN